MTLQAVRDQGQWVGDSAESEVWRAHTLGRMYQPTRERKADMVDSEARSDARGGRWLERKDEVSWSCDKIRGAWRVNAPPHLPCLRSLAGTWSHLSAPSEWFGHTGASLEEGKSPRRGEELEKWHAGPLLVLPALFFKRHVIKQAACHVSTLASTAAATKPALVLSNKEIISRDECECL